MTERTEQVTEDGIPRWMDIWNFYADLVDTPDALVPKDNNGFIKERRRWLAIRESVDLFYSLITDEDIEEHNARTRQWHKDYERQLEERYRAEARNRKRGVTPGYIYLIHSD